VPDLAAALPFYRDTLGLDEAWREGKDTVAFYLPDRKAQIMVVANGDPAGPMYKVDSVAGLDRLGTPRRLLRSGP
jgi:catechol 2,3-dioxygenase-like lactoylglutathione lyase family enzyme